MHVLLMCHGLYRNFKEHSIDQYLLSIATVSRIDRYFHFSSDVA